MSLKLILELIFPRFCLGCYKPGSYLCHQCQNKIPFIKITLCPLCERPSPYGQTHPGCQASFSLDGLTILSDYGGLTKTVIKKLKYHSVFELTTTLVQLFLKKYPQLPIKADFITFIPLHSRRERERGFNQALLLTKLLAKNYKIPCCPFLVKKINTQPQMSINNWQQRKANVKNVFSFCKTYVLKEKTVILVDDVATTGATLGEAAKVLKRNGACKVWGLVVARKVPLQFK